MSLLRRMFSRKWILTTILVVIACSVMVRLGFWQLDRLAQRRAFNARVLAQQDAPMLNLGPQAMDLDLYEMEYRQVFVTGTYDPEQEVVLRNQVYNRIPGYRLLTPLNIAGTDAAVMVDRGFIPSEDYSPGNWKTYAVAGPVEVFGVIRRSQSEPDFGGRADPTPLPGEQLKVWNLVNIEQMEAQMPYELLPVYVQQKLPEGVEIPVGTYPAPVVPELELTEGSHLGYAVQWYLFASVLGFGYPFFIRKETQSDGSKEE